MRVPSNDSDSFQRFTLGTEVREFKSHDSQQWDSFVLRHPLGTPFHLTAWKRTIEQTFDFKSFYLIATGSAGVTGVLPLFLVRNVAVGRALISSPFAVYGGVLAQSEDVRIAFAAYIRGLGRGLNVDYVELRNAWPVQRLGFSELSRYVSFTQQIGTNEKEIMDAIPRKTRYMVRKALKSGFCLESTNSSRAFELLYSSNLRRLGTPSFPPRYFANVIANFGNMVDIRQVVHDGKVVAAVMTFYFGDRVLPYYGASDPAFNALAPNNFMYFDLIRWAGQNGYKVFDFGRSKKEGSGSYDFKSHWGMEQHELPYEVLLVKRQSLPHFSPGNSRFQLAISIWRKLPLAVTRRLGPVVLKLFP